MRIFKIKKYISENKAILSAWVDSSAFSKPQNIFFCYPSKYIDYLHETADPFFPAVLIPAMINGEDIEIQAPLSARILENQAVIQDIFTTWHPDKFKRVKITAQALEKPLKKVFNKNATFFSLGVDSMYSMLKHLPQNESSSENGLSNLIYMKGLELPLSIYSKRQDIQVIQSIKRLAKHYNLEVIIGETNLRDIFPLDWEDYYFGPGLAATALSLSNGFSNIYIPSSHSYAVFFHDPSSPLLDHLWSNENTRIIHDGAEKERAQKISDLIVQDTYALNNLRVCVDNDGGIHNCGKCGKCIRTMVTLEILGLLKNSEIFPPILPKYFARQLHTFIPDSLEFTKENLKLAKKYGRKDIEKILEREIRLGNLEILRRDKSVGFVFRETVYYYYIKFLKKLGVLS